MGFNDSNELREASGMRAIGGRLWLPLDSIGVPCRFHSRYRVLLEASLGCFLREGLKGTRSEHSCN